jgi:hypothetical protein
MDAVSTDCRRTDNVASLFLCTAAFHEAWEGEYIAAFLSFVSETPRESTYNRFKPAPPFALRVAEDKVAAGSGGEEETAAAPTASRGTDVIASILPLTSSFHEASVGKYVAAFFFFAFETPRESI